MTRRQVRRITEADKIYIACILDNFGNFNSRKLKSGTVQPLIQMFGKKPKIMKWLAEVTGTTAIEIIKYSSRHNCTEHCPEAHAPVEFRSMRWQCTGVKATILLHNVVPYMRERKAEAKQLLEAGLQAHFKEAYVERMADMGWDIPNLDPINAVDT